MLMESILFFTFILVIAELVEAFFQKASTTLGILEKLYTYYQKSIFLFFLVQPSTFIIFMIILFTGVINIMMIFLVVLKIFDLFYKLELIKELLIEKKSREDLRSMLEYKLPPLFKIIGVMISPPILFLALL